MRRLTVSFVILAAATCLYCAKEPAPQVVFSCSPENDLYQVVQANGIATDRYDSPLEAVTAAPEGAAVLILADGYPEEKTPVDSTVYRLWAQSNLRLYVEFPAALPGGKTGPIHRTRWERAVVTTDAFGDSLRKWRILVIHDCHYVPVRAPVPLLVLARVAGFDRAVYRLSGTEAHPLLYQHPSGNLLVAATKLSQFVTARYGPTRAWAQVWRTIFRWLQPNQPAPRLRWTPTVRPTYGAYEALPEHARRRALLRGVAWYRRSRMLVNGSWRNLVDEAEKYPDRVGPAPSPRLPYGDGRHGILEGFSSQVRYDGSQPVRWYLRADCAGESAMACALTGLVSQDSGWFAVASNLLDFLYFGSNLQQGPRANPDSPSYGLLGWDTRPRGVGIYYGDDNARAVLGTLAAAAVLGSSRWDEAALRVILANFRTTGPSGFRLRRIEEPDLQKNGWKYYWRRDVTHFSPHYQSWIWACYLWLYDKTKYRPLLERARAGIRGMIQAYPDRWNWNESMSLERARMLLPLAWLVRVEDTPEHRRWLRRIADDLLAVQAPCGAIREQLGPEGNGRHTPPESNEEYGQHEASLVQENGDPVADMLYTSNFALVSLTEAAAATGDPRLTEAAERLADFLVRIQVRSEAHPELDGAWFRAFDYRRWEYWASSADAGWGAWTAETGWSQAWILAGLALHELGTNFWDLTASSEIARHFERYRKMMLQN